MKTTDKLIRAALFFLLTSILLAGCASAPDQLITARDTYANAEQSAAAQYAPTELKEAQDALADAEAAFEKLGPDDETSRTLAYVATRKAQLAVVVADTYASNQEKQAEEAQLLAENKDARENLASRLDAEKDLSAMTSRELSAERARLRDANAKIDEGEMTRDELAAKRVRIAELTARLDAEREDRLRLEAELARTRAKLEEVASIKEEPNRMIITLNGSVLFETNKSAVRAAATHRLDQLAQVLLAERSATITVMGYTDSEGTNAHNQTLSENRATTVRDYLVGQGVASDRITSEGLGESNPVASNSTATGRANNRRVEIVVDRAARSTSL